MRRIVAFQTDARSGRPDLRATLTKLHLFRLLQFRKVSNVTLVKLTR